MKKRYLGLVPVILVLSACTSNVQSTITVSSLNTYTANVVVSFDEEAAEVMSEDAYDKQLQDVFKSYTGKAAEVSTEDGVRSYTADVSYTQLTDAAGITGIKSASISGTEEDAQVIITQSAPGAIADAVIKATSTLDDQQGVVAAMLGSTHIKMDVVLPGGVQSAVSSSPNVDVSIKGDTAQVDQVLAQFENSDITVKGNLKAPLLTPLRGVIGGGSLLLLIGIVVFLRRR